MNHEHQLQVIVRGTGRAGRAILAERLIEAVGALGCDVDHKVDGLFVGGTASLEPRPRILVEEQGAGEPAKLLFEEGGLLDAMRVAGNELRQLRHRRDTLLEANSREVMRRRDGEALLREAAAQFRYYEQCHRAKCDSLPDSEAAPALEKAERNAEFAKRIEQFLFLASGAPLTIGAAA